MTTQTQQQELLAAIGLKLRMAREAQGITLQDVSSRTRIQNSFLEKIEQGELAGLPGFSFVRGFIRNYAQMLGVDDPDLIDQLQAMGRAADATPPPPMKQSTERLLDAEKAVGLPWPRIALLALLAILVLWVGYLLVRVFLPSDSAYEPPAPKAIVQAPAVSAPLVSAPTASAPILPGVPAPSRPPIASTLGRQSSVAVPITAAPVATGTIAAAPPGARPGMGPNALRVTLRGLEDTWVRYSLDRRSPFEVLMRTAESATLDADDEVRLTIGKSQGVSIYLNGEEVVLPTERNHLVADLVLNKLSVLKMRN